ncbi:MAG: Ig-like domain-containing protein [Gemmatimonadota bacterium]|nr:Ig-like domain-containing protein [Gemmatimonadota bacterium]
MKRQVAAASGVVSNARKWVTGIITTLAALMALMVNARNLGLSPWLGLFDPSYADRAARRIVLAPRSDTLRAIGDTALVTATVTDARGATLAGATLEWRSSDSTVAAVDSTGVIVARAAGRAIVEVHVWEVTARIAILVRPTPVQIRVAGDSARRLADGDSLRLVATVLDARDHPLPVPVPRWRSTDAQVVRVDSGGLAVALAPGRATLTATAGELETSVRVEVMLTPSVLVAERGDGQRALAGRALPEPLVLQVRTRTGQPVPGVGVEVATEDGEGTLSTAAATTDPRGRVRVTWTLGRRAGTQRLLARIPLVDSAFTIRADADPRPGDARVEVLDADVHGTAALPLVDPVRVRVADSTGTALVAVRLSWSTPDGGGVVGDARTDSLGNAEARWTLGNRAGTQRLLLQVGHPRYTPARTITAQARAANAAALALTSARPAKDGTVRLDVRVRDAHGNAVEATAVALAASIGSLSATRLVTDSTGFAQAVWTPPVGRRTGARISATIAGTKISTTRPLEATAPSPGKRPPER